MLTKWESPTAACLLTIEDRQEEELPLPTWREGDNSRELTLGEHLSQNQRRQIEGILTEFESVFSTSPGNSEHAD